MQKETQERLLDLPMPQVRQRTSVNRVRVNERAEEIDKTASLFVKYLLLS